MIKCINGVEIEMTDEEEEELIESLSNLGDFTIQTNPPLVYASAKFNINGDDITGVGVSSRFSGAFKADIGSYWIFFAESQPDNNYIAQAFDGGLIRCYVKPEDYGTDYLVITTTDLLGNPADPETISLIITKVN